ncbi:hypothetical protein [Paraburkholderia caffeinilytica]|uniref:hypothetical protein n=1 Tax=Paraburkholderia caffeinilytica TaxID=1761016 RepID=UPI0038BC9073
MLNDIDLPNSAAERSDTGFDAGAEPSAAALPALFGRFALCVATASALALGVVGTVAYGVWFNHDQQAYADAMARARQALGTAASAAAGAGLANSMAPPRLATFAAAPRSAATVAAEGTASRMQAPAVQSMATGTQVTTVAPATAQMQATAAAPDTEQGGQHASWSGPVTRLPAPAASQTGVADATPAEEASSAPAAQRAAPPSNPASQQLASSRPSRDARLAQQDRRSSSATSARHKDSLFARMGSFLRRVSYRQHGTGSQQDIYSHP